MPPFQAGAQAQERPSDGNADQGLYAVRCSGYFFSPGTNLFGWKTRRFFVLRGGIVMCYVDEAAFDARAAPLQSMTLTALTTIARRGNMLVIDSEPEVPDMTHAGATTDKQFRVVGSSSHKGVLRLEADNLADAIFWERELSVHLQELFGGIHDRELGHALSGNDFSEFTRSDNGGDAEDTQQAELSMHRDVELVETVAPVPAPAPERRYNTFEELAVAYITLSWARTGQLEQIKQYLQRSGTENAANLLRAAVRFKQYELVEYFLEEVGLDVNMRNHCGATPVWFSVVYFSVPDNNKMLKYLVSKGADLTIVDNFEQSLLHWAATSDDSSTIEYLVQEHKLNILHLDRFGASPLHMAAMWGRLSNVKAICNLGGYNTHRADWFDMFEAKNFPLINDFHRAAQHEWRRRGILRCAARLSPLGVAIMHQEMFISAVLLGGCDDGSVKMKYRLSLLEEECTDLCLAAKTWPTHLEWVLNAFTLSTKMNTGYINRKYALRELYGDPLLPTDRSPLAIIMKTGRAELFDHKVVENLVKLKWHLYGRKKYLSEFVVYALLLLFFSVGFIFVPGAEGQPTRLVAAAFCCYFLLWEEGCELLSTSLAYFQSGWNWVAVIGYVLTIAAAATSAWDPSFEYVNLLAAPAGLCILLRTMEHLAVWKTTGILIAMLRIMLQDTARWSLMYMLYVLSFSLTLFALLRGEEGHETFFSTLVTMILCTVGNITAPQSPSTAIQAAASVIMLIFVLLVTILYLNLLIAIMTLSFESVITRAEAEATMNQAQALLKWEATLPTSKKQELYKMLSPNPGERTLLTIKNGWFSRSNAEVVIDEHYVTLVEALDSQQKNSHQRFKDAITRSEEKIAALESSMQNFKTRLAQLSAQYRS